jgi:Ras-related protein Rab-11A
MNSKQEK